MADDNDSIDDEFDESTVVDDGLSARTLFGGFDAQVPEIKALPRIVKQPEIVRPAQVVVPPGPPGGRLASAQPVASSSASAGIILNTSDILSPETPSGEYPGAIQTPHPVASQSGVHTPPPGVMYTPAPYLPTGYGAQPGIASGVHQVTSLGPRSRTTLYIFSSVVLMLAGVGLSSLIFRDKDTGVIAPGPVQQPLANGQTGPSVFVPVPVPVPEVGSPAPDATVPEPVAPTSETPQAPAEDSSLHALVEPGGQVDDQPVEPKTGVERPLKAIQVKATMSGTIVKAFLSREKRVKKGARLFIIEQQGTQNDGKRAEQLKKIKELEQMAKDDPVYEPFLVRARQGLARNKARRVTITASRSGRAIPSVAVGDEIRDGQRLAKIE